MARRERWRKLVVTDVDIDTGSGIGQASRMEGRPQSAAPVRYWPTTRGPEHILVLPCKILPASVVQAYMGCTSQAPLKVSLVVWCWLTKLGMRSQSEPGLDVWLDQLYSRNFRARDKCSRTGVVSRCMHPDPTSSPTIPSRLGI